MISLAATAELVYVIYQIEFGRKSTGLLLTKFVSVWRQQMVTGDRG